MSVHDAGLAFHDITMASCKPTGSGKSGESSQRKEAAVSSGDSVSGFSLRKKSSLTATQLQESQSNNSQSDLREYAKPCPQFMCVKGAPDVLLAKCSHFLVSSKGEAGHRMLPVDQAFSACVIAAFEEMAAQVYFDFI
jgi:hypothetical protein